MFILRPILVTLYNKVQLGRPNVSFSLLMRVNECS